MTDDTTTNGLPGGPSNRWAWVLGLAVLATIVIWWFTSSQPPSPTPQPQNLVAGLEPLPIRISPDLTAADAVPAKAGTLSDANLLLVTLSSARADRIGCYGNDQIKTPAIDGLARRGVLFSRAVAPAPTTAASHASIMTGLYPSRHGVRGDRLYRLAADHQTLAQALADAGFATGAAVSVFYLDDRFGFARGFADYDEQVEAKTGGLSSVAWRRGDRTVQPAKDWLTKHAAQRFFLWVHLFDVHRPYQTPPPYAGTYAHMPYDGAVAFADAQLAELLSAIEHLGLADKTLVIVAGAHGESLDQHGEAEHGYLLYESTLHVPLVMACGDRLGGGVYVARRVSLVDVMPTALSLLGAPVPQGLDGTDLTAPAAEDRVVFAETRKGLIDYGWSAVYAAYQGPHKYIHAPDPEMYDLVNDPFEQSNVIASAGQIAGAVQQRLTETFNDIDPASVAEDVPAISNADLERLKTIGYVGGADGGTAPAEKVDRPDPKAVLPLKYRVDAVLETITSEAGLDPAAAELKKIITEHNDLVPAYIGLAETYASMKRLDWAESAYLEANKLYRDIPSVTLALGRIKVAQGQKEAAVALYRQLATLYPDYLVAQAELGTVLRDLGRLEEAVEPLTKAVEAVPSEIEVQNALFDALVQLDRGDERAAILRRCLTDRPAQPDVSNALARVVYESGDYAGAVAVLREAMRLTPDQPQLATNLAAILANCEDETVRDPAEAVAMMARICDQHPLPEYMLTLTIAQDAAGQLTDAIATAEKAQRLAETTGKPQLAQKLVAYVAQLRQKQQPATPTTAPADAPLP